MKKHSRNMGRMSALARLGLLTSALYMAPVLAELNQASASGGGFFGGMGGGSGGGMGGGSGAISTATDPLTAKECGDCHIPYSPRYLPDGSWRQIMTNLSDHFGEDASLDANTQQHITQYLTSNAGGNGMGALRITDTNWWVSEHRGEISSWSLQRIGGSPSNCNGCHYVPGQPQNGFNGANANQPNATWGRW